jgi:hypothetical protein
MPHCPSSLPTTLSATGFVGGDAVDAYENGNLWLHAAEVHTSGPRPVLED